MASRYPGLLRSQSERISLAVPDRAGDCMRPDANRLLAPLFRFPDLAVMPCPSISFHPRDKPSRLSDAAETDRRRSECRSDRLAAWWSSARND